MTSSPPRGSSNPAPTTTLVDPPGFAPIDNPPAADVWNGGYLNGEPTDPIPPNPSTSSSTSESARESTPSTSSSEGSGDYYDELEGDVGLDAAELEAELEAEAEPPPSGESSTPGSTARPEGFVALVGVGLGLAGLGLHNALTPGPNEVWLVDEHEIRDIAEPLSRIVARRVKLPSNAAASDLSDGLEAGVAAAGYALKNYQRTAELRAAQSSGIPWPAGEPAPAP